MTDPFHTFRDDPSQLPLPIKIICRRCGDTGADPDFATIEGPVPCVACRNIDGSVKPR